MWWCHVMTTYWQLTILLPLLWFQATAISFRTERWKISLHGWWGKQFLAPHEKRANTAPYKYHTCLITSSTNGANTPRTIPITFYCVVIVATIPYLANIRWAYRLLLTVTEIDYNWGLVSNCSQQAPTFPQWTMTNTVSELPVNMCDLC